jgi:hypothetical protein
MNCEDVENRDRFNLLLYLTYSTISPLPCRILLRSVTLHLIPAI